MDRSLHRSAASASVIAELADSFPQVFEFEKQLRLFLDPVVDSTEIADSCEGVYRRADTQVRLRAILTPTLSRLSNSTRADRLALTLNEEVAEDLRNQARELAENTERVKLEHEQVVLPLRDEVLSLQTATGEVAKSAEGTG